MKEQSRYPGRMTSIAAVVSMLAGPLAWSAPGDLDPAFGDIGRVTELPGLIGDVRSIGPHGHAFVLGGGDVMRAEDSELDTRYGFTARILNDGSIDPVYEGAVPPNLTVYDVVVDSDGRAIGVGQAFTAFRLTLDGALDATFGEGGLAHAPADADLSFGASVALDDFGRAVIAGISGSSVVVFRLLTEGAVDTTFGEAGVYTSAPGPGFLSRPRLLRVPDGYRVMFHSYELPQIGRPMPNCWVVALRDDGVLDTTFTGSGVFRFRPRRIASCAALAAQPDGGLVIVDTRGGAIRLLASGEQDAGFSAEDAMARMSEVTAIAAASDGSLLMAGRGDTDVPGSLVVKLRADGRLDTSFGTAGTTWIDLPSSSGLQTVHDIVALARGGIVLAGGVPDAAGLGHPFVARLLGDAGADSPGVLGVKRLLVDATSNSNQAVVTVRRSGGSAGAISVAYRTRTNPDVTMPATEGQDYVATSGRLTWADGDSEDKEIAVQLLGDIDGNPENDRTFEVQLSDVQSGGLGSTTATVNTGYPAAILQVDPTNLSVSESQGTVSFIVARDGGLEGAVSVMLTASAGTATAASDYQFESTTIEWADGDSATKTVTIPILDDNVQESSESFSIDVARATNGAVIGSSVVMITIDDDDQSTSSDGGGPGGSSGGGDFGVLSVILLSLAGAFRAVRQRVSRGPAFQKE